MKQGKIEIGIIGGRGGMGKWFSALLREQGYVVHQSGRRSGMSMEEMSRRCSVVVVSVPIETTSHVIKSIGPLLDRESLLMDMTSLKEDPVHWMLSSTDAEVMGCHPLFGPNPDPGQDLSVVLCPARMEKWSAWPAGVFRDAGLRVIETTPENHDRVMAVVQGINHLNSILMSLIIRECGIGRQELEKFATPLFRSKLAITDKVDAGNSRMYAEIMAGNQHLSPLLHRYGEIFRELCDLLQRGEVKAAAERIVSPYKDTLP
ncbi:MAG: prephenate dehydrogenase/arogenate dehydrogenase family protein [Syntrophales bacterium]|nr:prephenate dehydrogenase/arogenate dehydrogenase family protein [Syntrophales bacterium]